MKKMLYKIFNKLGLVERPPDLTSLDLALQRIAHRKTCLNSVIDVGASNGCWSERLRKYYPDAFCFLVEANPYHQKALEQFKTQHPKIDYVLAAAGDTEGEIYFDGNDPFGGLASHEALDRTNLKVPVVTIDSICEAHQLQPPYLIKLDTHGFEIPIFEGAKEALKHTSLIVVEVYNFNLTSDSLRFPQLCQYLEDKGFQCIDMCDPMFREKDGSLWQFDLFFIPKEHPVFLDNSWL